MPPQHRFGLHNKERIAPTSEPSTGANPELSVRIAQARLRVPAVQHEPLLPQAQILGNQQGLRLESGRNDPDEKANHPPLRPVPGCRRGAKPRDCQPQSLWTVILRPTGLPERKALLLADLYRDIGRLLDDVL